MSDRIFTLAEAQETLRALRPVAERMVALRARQRETQRRRSELREALVSNGHGLTVNDLALADREVQELGRELDACIGELVDAGVQVKDLELGTLDFPTLRDGREALLCWRVGEDEIAHWHGPDEGFAGRKPLAGGE